MSDIDARLIAALQADAAPADDVMFRVDTLARLERARYRRHVWLTAAVASATAVLLTVYVTAIGTWMASSVWHAAIVPLGALIAMFALLRDVPVETLRGSHAFARLIDRWLYR